MDVVLFYKILKYIDCFGTNFNFYTEKNRKLYTPLGGILTLFSFISGALIFILINFDELKHDKPLSSTSVIQEDYHNIKFIEEKIWIPWRIRDYEGNLANFSGLLYPIIYYYNGIRNKTEDRLNLKYRFLNYKLCNETNMINNTDLFTIDVDLDQLYCIDMEELDMGGNWDWDYINYVEFDLYICKNGIDYDENNTDCTSYEELIKAAQNYNSFEFEIYYPLVHYQPMNKSTPIFMKYNSYFYHLSRFSNKIDRIYLQKNVLIDDRGYVSKKEKITEFWGCETLNGDSYATGDKKDLMSEGSSSRLYSFNIYLNFETNIHHRYYKNLFLILIDGLPIVYVVFNFFKFIAKIFKISAGNKKLTELLFENLQEKPSKIKKNKINNNINNNNFHFERKNTIFDTKNMIKNSNKHASNDNTKFTNDKNESNININNNDSNNGDKLNNHNISIINNHDKSNNSNNVSEFSSINLTHQDLIKNRIHNNQKPRYSIEGRNKNLLNIKFKPNNLFNNANGNSPSDTNSYNLFEFFNHKSKDLLSQGGNSLYKKDSKTDINYNKLESPKTKKYYVKKKLFPYKYYLCSIFIKNIDVKKKSCFFTRKFIVVYNFICQLFDISSYLILQKEFQIMKNTIAMGKYKDLLETNQKINVNAHYFNVDMKECLDTNKFSILGRVKETKEEE